MNSKIHWTARFFASFLLGGVGAVIGALVATVGFGSVCWLLCASGFIEKADAILKIKVAIIAFSVLGFVFGLIRVVKIERARR